jgi:hypothetical protein
LEKHGITSFNMAKQVKEIRSKKLWKFFLILLILNR